MTKWLREDGHICGQYGTEKCKTCPDKGAKCGDKVPE